MSATAAGFQTQKDSTLSIPSICRQIDELQRISASYKNDQLSQGWYKEVKEFYALSISDQASPSFRPRVIIPELQMFMLSEAGDVTDNSPVIYLSSQGEGKPGRDKDREQAIRGAWRQGQFNIQLFLAQLWANLGGTGIVMVGFDPWARDGRGMVWVKAIDPDHFYPDPSAQDDEDWEFATLAERKYVDWVRNRFPEQGWNISPQPINKTPNSSDTMLSMPFGPMTMSGLPPGQMPRSDGLVEFRRCFTNDRTVEKVKHLAGSSAGKEIDIAPSRFKKKWPNGRLTIDCENVILYDGDNYVPHGKFPFKRFLGMPSLEGFWGPPPIRYSRGLQDLAGRMYSQTFENAIRLNNGWILIPDSSGIDADKIGGLPGEIVVYNANAQALPDIKYPQPMPAHFTQLPQILLEEQRRLQGHNEARQGNPGAGNISEDLYEASIAQASKITKIRSRFFAASVQNVAEMVFYFMARFHRNSLQFPPAESGTGEVTTWEPISDSAKWDVWLDEGSIQPMSQQMLRKTAMALKQAGLYDTESTLEALGIPNAGEIAQKTQQELALAALAKVKKGARQVS